MLNLFYHCLLWGPLSSLLLYSPVFSVSLSIALCFMLSQLCFVVHRCSFATPALLLLFSMVYVALLQYNVVLCSSPMCYALISLILCLPSHIFCSSPIVVCFSSPPRSGSTKCGRQSEPTNSLVEHLRAPQALMDVCEANTCKYVCSQLYMSQ